MLVVSNRAYNSVVDIFDSKYVQTYADSNWDDNLTALPECSLR